MYTLYYSPGACSMAVHVIFNELGEKVNLVNVSVPQGQPKPAEFLKVNPRGQVPVVVDDGQAIREGGAILVYLLDKHKSPLLPREGKARARALEWLMFSNATLHPAYGKLFHASKALSGDVQAHVKSAAIEQINKLWQDVEKHLSGSEYLAGDEITVGDILMTVIANWSANFPGITLGTNAKRLFKKVIARPSYQKALAAEKVEYKVAA